MKRQNLSYIWDVPGKPVRAEITFDVIDRLVAETGRGMEAVPEGGAEIGGLLLGEAVSGDRHFISIRRIEPIKCEYAYGPTYVLTERDEKRLSSALGRWRDKPDGLQPVGFYRSHTRGELSLTEQDLWLFASHFSAPQDIALIVKPRPDKPPAGGFFFWENGTLKSDNTYQEFVLDRQELGGEALEPPATVIPEDEPASEPRLPLASFLGRNREAKPALRKVRITPLKSPSTLAALASGLILAGGALGFVAGRLWRPEPPAPAPRDPYGLSLAVTEYGNNLHLTWDRTAPAIASARRGTVTISDGQAMKSVELGKDQLRLGSVVYRRLTPDVNLRLEIYVNDRDSVAQVWKPKPPSAVQGR